MDDMKANIRIFNDVVNERRRQRELKAAGKFKYVPTDPEVTRERHITWITEELGEAATEVNDLTTFLESGESWSATDEANYRERVKKLRAELIQTITLTWGWIHKIDTEMDGVPFPRPRQPLDPTRRRATAMEVHNA